MVPVDPKVALYEKELYTARNARYKADIEAAVTKVMEANAAVRVSAESLVAAIILGGFPQ